MRLLPLIAPFVLLTGLMMPASATAQTDSQVAVAPGTLSRSIDTKKVHLDQNLGRQIPLDATFRDRTGKSVTFGQMLGGRPAILLPIFYKCTGVCGLELQGSIAALKGMKGPKLGTDFSIIVVSIHPKETPDLAEGKYESTVQEVNLPGTEKGWHFVVGDWANIHKVTDAVGFNYTYDEANDAINHPSGIMFVTPAGVVSSYIYGATYTPHQFERDLDTAGRAKVGAKTQELFFGCIHVDPLTGKRSVVIEKVLRIAGIITVLGIALSIFLLSGKSPFKKKA